MSFAVIPDLIRDPGSMNLKRLWIPAFAGMTTFFLAYHFFLCFAGSLLGMGANNQLNNVKFWGKVRR